MGKVSGILLASLIGICLGLQPPINSTLGKSLTPKIAAFHSILTSFIIIFVVALFSGDLTNYKNIVNIHPIYWIGGVLGACIVLFSIFTIPVLGASASITIFVTIQLIVGTIIDHFGLLGINRSPVDLKQTVGMIILLIGVKLILK
jgi:transporter family-2 protein